MLKPPAYLTWQLHLAASFGNTEIVEQLLQIEGVNIDDAGRSGMDCTPLAMAAMFGRTAAMEKLITHGANVNAIDDDNGPVVNGAILSGNRAAVELLIRKGAKLDYPLSEDDEMPWPPPLACAALNSDLAMLDTVLEAGSNGLSPEEYEKGLVFGALSGRVEVVSRLLQFNQSSETFQDALDAALEEDNWDVIKLLLDSTQDLDCDEVFEKAATHPESLEDMLNAVWKYSHETIDQDLLNNCLYKAADNEKEETVKLLLKMGASPDAEGEG